MTPGFCSKAVLELWRCISIGGVGFGRPVGGATVPPKCVLKGMARHDRLEGTGGGGARVLSDQIDSI